MHPIDRSEPTSSSRSPSSQPARRTGPDAFESMLGAIRADTAWYRDVRDRAGLADGPATGWDGQSVTRAEPGSRFHEPGGSGDGARVDADGPPSTWTPASQRFAAAPGGAQQACVDAPPRREGSSAVVADLTLSVEHPRLGRLEARVSTHGDAAGANTRIDVEGPADTARLLGARAHAVAAALERELGRPVRVRVAATQAGAPHVDADRHAH